MSEADLRRFYSFCVVDLETGCWNWRGGTYGSWGYGQFCLAWISHPAHLVAYNHFVGEVPEGFELGHIRKKDKRAFWEHVRPITHKENIAEAYSPYCSNGHLKALFGVHTVSHECKVCSRVRHAARRGRVVCNRCGYVACRC